MSGQSGHLRYERTHPMCPAELSPCKAPPAWTSTEAANASGQSTSTMPNVSKGWSTWSNQAALATARRRPAASTLELAIHRAERRTRYSAQACSQNCRTDLILTNSPRLLPNCATKGKRVSRGATKRLIGDVRDWLVSTAPSDRGRGRVKTQKHETPRNHILRSARLVECGYAIDD